MCPSPDHGKLIQDALPIVERRSLLVDVLPNVVPLVRVLTAPPLNR